MKVAIVILFVYLYGPYYGLDFSVPVSISPMFTYLSRALQLEGGFVAIQN